MTLLLIFIHDQKLADFKSTVAAHKVISEFTSVLSAINAFRDKLIFIIILLTLVLQWIDKINCAIQKLKIYIYYNNYYNQSEAVITIIDQYLMCNHELFDDHSTCIKYVIIISYSILTNYHDSSALTDWWLDIKKMNAVIIKIIHNQCNLLWSDYLDECFSQIVLNETHLIKNCNSNQVLVII